MNRFLIAALVVLGLAAVGHAAPRTFAQAAATCTWRVNRAHPEGFDSYVPEDGRVRIFGTKAATFAFDKCMHELGHTVDPVPLAQEGR